MIQLAVDDAVQAHSAVVATSTVAVAPPGWIDAWGAVTWTAHLTGLGAVLVVEEEPQAAAARAMATMRHVLRRPDIRPTDPPDAFVLPSNKYASGLYPREHERRRFQRERVGRNDTTSGVVSG